MLGHYDDLFLLIYREGIWVKQDDIIIVELLIYLGRGKIWISASINKTEMKLTDFISSNDILYTFLSRKELIVSLHLALTWL